MLEGLMLIAVIIRYIDPVSRLIDSKIFFDEFIPAYEFRTWMGNTKRIHPSFRDRSFGHSELKRIFSRLHGMEKAQSLKEIVDVLSKHDDFVAVQDLIYVSDIQLTGAVAFLTFKEYAELGRPRRIKRTYTAIQ